MAVRGRGLVAAAMVGIGPAGRRPRLVHISLRRGIFVPVLVPLRRRGMRMLAAVRRVAVMVISCWVGGRLLLLLLLP